MAQRRRYERRSRRIQNVTWQPVQFKNVLSVPAGTTGDVVTGNLGETRPGVGVGTLHKPFNDDHTLERIRGCVSHNGASSRTPSPPDGWFPFTLALLKVPNGFDLPTDFNLFDSDEGDDFPLRLDVVCNVNATVYPNYHEVDGKAKRRFEAGDVFAWLWSLVRPIDAAFTVSVAFNGRFLWRLKV